MALWHPWEGKEVQLERLFVRAPGQNGDSWIKGSCGNREVRYRVYFKVVFSRLADGFSLDVRERNKDVS